MFFRHLRQHIVRRPVDNAHDLRDAVRRQAFLQRLDDRDTSADTRLIEEIHCILICRGIELGEMLGDHILVCRNYVLARRHCTHHIVFRRGKSPHDLDDDRDLCIVENFIEVICQRNPLGFRTMFFCIAYENLLDLNTCTAALCDRI